MTKTTASNLTHTLDELRLAHLTDDGTLADLTEIGDDAYTPDAILFGDVNHDGCVTVYPNDTVTVWAGGDAVHTASVPGAHAAARAV